MRDQSTGGLPPAETGTDQRRATDRNPANLAVSSERSIPGKLGALPGSNAEHVAEPVDMPAESAMEKRKLLLRGEAAIARPGLIMAGIVVVALLACGWWTYRVQYSTLVASRHAQINATALLLAQSSENLLAQDDTTTVRRMMADAARNAGLKRCRILLGDGIVVASNDAKEINLNKLPATWQDNVMEPARNLSNSTMIAVTTNLNIPSRGKARLELIGSIDYPFSMFFETEAGIGAIGAAALIAVLLIYRNMRWTLRAVGAIREALLAMKLGEKSMAALTVGPELGIEAVAWNELLIEKEKLSTLVLVRGARDQATDRRVSNGELDAAFDAMSQGLILIGENQEARFTNGAASVFLQKRREDITGKKADQFIKFPEVLKAIAGVADGTVRRRMTIEVKQGGEQGHGVLKFSVRPVRRDDSGVAMVIIEDVTQQRVADESRNAFVAQATHELRTPLTNIRLYVETAIDEGEANPAIRAKALNVINQEARRLENIVGEMLTVSQIEAGSFKLNRGDVRLDALFTEIQSDYAEQAKDKKLTLTMNLPPKLPAIKADREKLSVALHNMVGNAMKYTPAPGAVTINVSIDKTTLTVEVQDTGIGIAEEDQKKVFDKFYRAKDPRVSKIVGTGLGLTLAREVMRLHGGDITLESQLNKGSMFTLKLPVAVEAV